LGAVLQRQDRGLGRRQVDHIEDVVGGVASCPSCTSEFLEATVPARGKETALHPDASDEVAELMLHVHLQEGTLDSHAVLAAPGVLVGDVTGATCAATRRGEKVCQHMLADASAGAGGDVGGTTGLTMHAADSGGPSSPTVLGGSQGSHTPLQASPRRVFERPVNSIGKGNLWMEYSDAGTGDFRPPSFLVVYANGSSITPLKYKSHRILPGKEKLQGFLPSIRCRGADDATTLVVTMADQLCGLEVDLHYVCMHHHDVITRHAVFRNVGSCSTCHEDFFGVQVLELAHSMTLDLDTSNTGHYLTKLSGSWARERYVCESQLVQGTHTFESCKGVSSHEHQPFLALSTAPARENEGEVIGFVLAYSGNFLAQVHVNRMGGARVNLGINSANFQWNLHPNEEGFCTPEAILARSGAGLGGLSRTFHRLFLECLIPAHPWAETCISADSDGTGQAHHPGPCCSSGSQCDDVSPIDNSNANANASSNVNASAKANGGNRFIPALLVNTWEAKYFQIDHESCLELGRLGASIGMNTLVIDDGWFGTRNSTKCSIGDWVVNAIKFPFGLDGLARELNCIGMKLGIWIEPEMLSINSDLFRRCPHWALGVKEGFMTVGRDQLVLDLSNPEVREHIFETMSAFLSSNPGIEYIKWDMNRPLTEVFSQGCFERGRQCRSKNSNSSTPNTDRATCSETFASSSGSCSSAGDTGANSIDCRKVSQSETLHRCVLGLYELQTRILEAFPYILLENCASGGGRFDPGMLYFSPQIWCSDNTDAIARMKIQYGTSLLYPARCIGAHISAVPNHITGNTTRLRTRGLLAMCGTFG
jgi:alpha-galactosidase